MVKLTADMKEAFSKMKVFPVATANKDGTPNVIPLGIAELVSDDTVWFVDNFMNKTLSNLRTNPKIAFFVWGPEDQRMFPVQGSCCDQDKWCGIRSDESKAQHHEPGTAGEVTHHREDHRDL